MPKQSLEEAMAAATDATAGNGKAKRSRKPAAVEGENGSAPPPPAAESVVLLPIDTVRPSAHNPRTDVRDTDALAESIRAVGILEPLLVEPVDDAFEIQ